MGLHGSTTEGCPGGPPQPGGLHTCLVIFYVLVSRVGWASTAPLLKANQGPPQPGDLHICLVTFCFLVSRVGWASTAPLLKAAQGGFHNQGASTYVLSPFIFWYSMVGWGSTAPLLKAGQGPPQPGDLHICLVTFYFLVF